MFVSVMVRFIWCFTIASGRREEAGENDETLHYNAHAMHSIIEICVLLILFKLRDIYQHK